MENVELNVNLTERSFSIKGTEEFVDRKTKEIVELLEKFGSVNSNQKTIIQNVGNNIEPNEQNNVRNSGNKLQKYIDAGILSIDGEDVMILRKVPGKNNADKTKKIALIIILALNKPILSKLIVQNCEQLGCYDASNFSKIFKNDKSGKFIRKGSGQSWTLDATIPGKEYAVEVLEEMCNAIKK